MRELKTTMRSRPSGHLSMATRAVARVAVSVNDQDLIYVFTCRVLLKLRFSCTFEVICKFSHLVTEVICELIYFVI